MSERPKKKTIRFDLPEVDMEKARRRLESMTPEEWKSMLDKLTADLPSSGRHCDCCYCRSQRRY